MGKSSSPKTQTVTETSEPWAGAQPYLTQALGAASAEYGRGAPDYFPGQTVANLSGTTQAGLNAVGANANRAPGLVNTGLNWLGSAAAPGANTGQSQVGRQAQGLASNPAGAQLTNLAGRQIDVSGLNTFKSSGGTNPYLQSFSQVAGAPVNGAGMDTLTQAATGGMMQNPWLDDTFRRGSEAIRGEVDSAFNRAGRNFGSANYGDALGENLAGFASDLYGGAYETDMARRMGAAGQLAGYEQAGVDRQLGALGAQAGLAESQMGRQLDTNRYLSDLGFADIGQDASLYGAAGNLYQGDLAQQLAAYSALANQGNADAAQQLSAAGMLPAMYGIGQQGGADLLGAGGLLDQYNQTRVNANIDRWNYDQNANRSNIEWLNAIASGAGSLGSTQTGQVPYSPGNPWLQGIGAAGTAATGLSQLLPLLGFSDRDTKTDIDPIAYDPRGFTWNSFRYKWDAPEVRRIGVMADEVAAVLPHAVVRDPVSGFDMIDYGALA